MSEYVYGWYHYQDGTDVKFRYPEDRSADLREGGKRVTVEIFANAWVKRVGQVVESNGNFTVIPTPAAALGSIRSARKSASSRENGRKGGRPSKRALAERRIDTMGLTDAERDFVFADWNEGDEHLDWLLTASKTEIEDWIAAGK